MRVVILVVVMFVIQCNNDRIQFPYGNTVHSQPASQLEPSQRISETPREAPRGPERRKEEEGNEEKPRENPEVHRS